MEMRCYGCMELTEEPVCPACGWERDRRNETHQLPAGTVLQGRYLLGRALGQGGFGITYIGWDLEQRRKVCVKEFFPSSIINRDMTQGPAVRCNTENLESVYASSRERFLREAHLLARFTDAPQIVSIFDFFEMNNTAYMVLEFVKGIDLYKYIRQKAGALTMDETMRILKPVMEALKLVHETGMVHRDVSPDNVMLHPVEGAKLLDFGDAERELARSTEAILKNGFAPMEQYSTRGSLGPWTDVYALCATIYYCVTGRVLENAPQRMLYGPEVDWSGAQGVTDAQKVALMKGLELRAVDRTASIAELMAALYGEESFPAPVPAEVEGTICLTPEKEAPRPELTPEPAPQAAEPEAESVPKAKKKRRLWPVLAVILLVLAGVGIGGWHFSRIAVTGAELDRYTLERLLLEDHSAIGYYEVATRLPLTDTREILFPVGAAYEGVQITVTDADDGSSVTATTTEGLVRAKLAPEGAYLLQVRTADTEAAAWTQWSETLPQGVELNDATVEVDIRYRDRDKEYAESYYDTMEGWILLDSRSNDTPYSDWTDWTEEERTASDTLEVEQKHEYRTRQKEKTTSSTMLDETWTLVNTEVKYQNTFVGGWYTYDPRVEGAITYDVVEHRWTHHISARIADIMLDWNESMIFRDAVGALPAGWTVGNTIMYDGLPYVIQSVDSYEEWRGIHREETGRVYHYERWGDWSEWSESPITEEAGADRENEEREVYRSREICGDLIYRFWRWQPWTEWSLTAPSSYQQEMEYEEQVVYRYIP